MERAEAIKVLTNHLVHWKRLKHEHIVPTDECENTINALRMAIKALKADDKDEPQFYTEDDYWNGMFTESAEAYKAWTREEMGCKSFTADEWYRNTFKDGDEE